MATVQEPNKTKIAKRVIEIFEFFDDGHQRANVMDIVRRYGRPQSSTSELLSSLVDMGLLYKDPRSRFYFPTPRMASLGTSAQPAIIRNGRLFSEMDRLAMATGSGVALFGMVGTCVQVFRWSQGADAATRNVGCGASMRLSASTAGLLLLSTLPQKQAEKLLWRLNAEAEADDKFSPVRLGECVAASRRRGHATGPSGFAPDTQLTVRLVPCPTGERPLALGVIYSYDAPLEAHDLVTMLGQCSGEGEGSADDDHVSLPLPAMFTRPHEMPTPPALHAP